MSDEEPDTRSGRFLATTGDPDCEHDYLEGYCRKCCKMIDQPLDVEFNERGRKQLKWKVRPDG